MPEIVDTTREINPVLLTGKNDAILVLLNRDIPAGGYFCSSDSLVSAELLWSRSPVWRSRQNGLQKRVGGHDYTSLYTSLRSTG